MGAMGGQPTKLQRCWRRKDAFVTGFALALGPKCLAGANESDTDALGAHLAGQPVPSRGDLMWPARNVALVASGGVAVSYHAAEDAVLMVLGEVENVRELAELAGEAGASAAAACAALFAARPLAEWVGRVGGRFALVAVERKTGRALVVRGPHGSPAIRYRREDGDFVSVLAGGGLEQMKEAENDGERPADGRCGRDLAPCRYLYGNNHFDIPRKFAPLAAPAPAATSGCDRWRKSEVGTASAALPPRRPTASADRWRPRTPPTPAAAAPARMQSSPSPSPPRAESPEWQGVTGRNSGEFMRWESDARDLVMAMGGAGFDAKAPKVGVATGPEERAPVTVANTFGSSLFASAATSSLFAPAVLPQTRC